MPGKAFNQTGRLDILLCLHRSISGFLKGVLMISQRNEGMSWFLRAKGWRVAGLALVMLLAGWLATPLRRNAERTRWAS